MTSRRNKLTERKYASQAKRLRYARGKLNVPKTLAELYPPHLVAKLLVMIRSGVWPYVAAQTVGLSRATYYRWTTWGEAGTEPYKSFYEAVTREHAAARAGAESAVWLERPDMWLMKGPGRDVGDPERPGWADEVKMRHTGADGASPPTLRLEFHAAGPRTAVTPAPALPPGEEEGEPSPS